MKNLIEVKNLSVAYDGITVVQNVNFTLMPHSVLVLVGESGSGKSTILRAINGLLSVGGKITSGEILFDGINLNRYEEKEMRSLRGKEIAMIFQDAGIYLDSKRRIGYQYIESIRSHLKVSKKEAKQLAKNELLKLSLIDTDRIMNSYPFELSGGMLQRVAIAMAMTMQPRLLLTDEPTSALDVTTQAQVVKELMQLRDTYNTTIILVTHNMGIASYMADYIFVMKEGQMVEYGTRDQIIKEPKKTYTKRLLEAIPNLEENSDGD